MVEVGKVDQGRDEGGVSLILGSPGSRTCRIGPHLNLTRYWVSGSDLGET